MTGIDLPDGWRLNPPTSPLTAFRACFAELAAHADGRAGAPCEGGDVASRYCQAAGQPV